MAARGIFVAEPSCKFICDKVLEECLIGRIGDEGPVLVLGHAKQFLFIFEFNLVAGFGHSGKTGVASSLDGQV